MIARHTMPSRQIQLLSVAFLLPLLGPSVSHARDLAAEYEALLRGPVRQITYQVQNFSGARGGNDNRPTKILEFNPQGQVVSSSTGRSPMRTDYRYAGKRLVGYTKHYVTGKIKDLVSVSYDDITRTETHRYVMDGLEYQVETFAYDQEDRLIANHYRITFKDSVAIKDRRFYYDDSGRLERMRVSGSREYRGPNRDFKWLMSGNFDVDVNYSYSKSGQLKESVTTDRNSGAATERHVYEVDDQGNWVRKIRYVASYAGEKMELQRIITRVIRYYPR